MKRFGYIILSACLILMMLAISGISGARAERSGIWGDLSWSLDNSGTLTISGSGPMKQFPSSAYYSTSTYAWRAYRTGIFNVVIEEGITSICSDAFEDCRYLKSITIPSSVRSIGGRAFSSCNSLVSIIIPDGVTNINGATFYGCRSLTNITIPQSVASIGLHAFDDCINLPGALNLPNVKYIGNYAFNGCKKLTSITLSSNMSTIGAYAFSGCVSLTGITMPPQLTEMGAYVFSGCSSLTSITLPSGITNIGESAFSGCSSLKSITIPSSVTSISIGAFSNCNSLTSITIPSSVTSIGNSLSTCKGLKSINVASGNSCYSSGNGVLYDKEKTTLITCPPGKTGSVTIPSGVTSISNSAFANCSLTSVTIPSSVTSIGNHAFYNCDSLTSAALPSGVTSLGISAFANCDSLASVTIPSSVTSIGLYAFDHCTGLKSVTIPNSINSISDNTFAYCTSLTSIKIPSSVTSIGSYAFDHCTGLRSLTIPNSVTTIGAFAFRHCDGLASVTIPGSVKTLSSAFLACKGLTTVTIQSGVETIGGSRGSELYNMYGAFQNCTALTSVTIPSSVTSIDNGAFSYCSSLASITIPSGVTNIGESAFYKCTGLRSITIPSSVTKIGSCAFEACTSLTSITIPASVTSIDSQAFNNCSRLSRVEYSGELKNWIGISFANSASNPLSNGAGLWIGGSQVKNAVIPSGVASIGRNAFYGCSGLSSMTLSASVKDIGESAFCGCVNLTSISLSSGLTTIPNSAFYGCRGLTTIALPVNLNKIGDSAFAYCDGLTSVTIPAGVTSIGSSAFSACSSLTSVLFLGDAPNSIGTGAFNADAVILTYLSGSTGWSMPTWKGYRTNKQTATDPEITIQPESVTVQKKNETATVTVSAEGDGLTYVWYYKDVNMTDFLRSKITTASYSVPVSAERDGRQLYCLISNEYGRSVKSNTVTIRVAVPLAITAQPNNVKAAAAGDEARVTIKAVGEGLTYQWYLKNPGKTDFSKSSVTSATYSFTVTQAANGRQVYCIVTDQYGNSVTSNTVTVYIPSSGPIITTQPQNVTVAEAGNEARITVKAVGDGLTYQWYLKNPGKTDFSKSSVTSATYSFTVTQAANGRQVYCVVTDQYGNSVTSNTVTVYIPSSGPVIITQPQNVTVSAAGNEARVTVKAVGDGLTYQWYLKNPGKTDFSKSSVTSATYSFAVTQAVNGRQVYCIVTDQNGKSVQSNTVMVSIASSGPIITTQPQNVTVSAAGNEARVTVKAVGDGLTYQWYLKNPGKTDFSKSSVTSATYSFTVTQAVNGRQVYCVVTDQNGKSVQSNTVMVSIASSGPIITTQPQNVTVSAAGNEARVTVKAVGDGLTYQWYLKNPGKTDFSKSSVTSATYSFAVTQAANGRQVYCIVTDQNGKSIQSNTVTVSIAPSSPVITSQPASVTVETGAEATFKVVASGSGLSYQWYYQKPGEDTWNAVTKNGTSAAYSLTTEARHNGYTYRCKVTNSSGAVYTNTATLTLK